MWQPHKDARGLSDEEHTEGARITLESDVEGAPYVITCGIYGWMVHTRYFSADDDTGKAYAQMKDELDRIVRAIPLKSDPDCDAKVNEVIGMMNRFVEQFP